MKISRLLGLGAALLSAPLASFAANWITVIDTDMTGASFTSFSLAYDNANFDPDPGNASADGSINNIGSPNDDVFEGLAFLDPVDPSEPGATDGYTIQTVHTFDAFSWNPTTDGEITAVRFWIDALSAENLTVYFTIDQDFYGFFAFPPNAQPDISSDFQTISYLDWPVSQFSSGDFVSGGPIKFGFGFLFSTNDENGGQSQVSFDNFRVDVCVVPEPSALTLALSGLALSALVITRRRR